MIKSKTLYCCCFSTWMQIFHCNQFVEFANVLFHVSNLSRYCTPPHPCSSIFFYARVAMKYAGSTVEVHDLSWIWIIPKTCDAFTNICIPLTASIMHYFWSKLRYPDIVLALSSQYDQKLGLSSAHPSSFPSLLSIICAASSVVPLSWFPAHTKPTTH